MLLVCPNSFYYLWWVLDRRSLIAYTDEAKSDQENIEPKSSRG